MKMMIERRDSLNAAKGNYRVSCWWYLFAFGNVAMGALVFSFYLLFPESNLPAVSEFTFLGIAFMAFASFGFWKLRTAYVVIDEHELRFKFGRKSVVADLRGVNQVIVKGAFIILDEGRIPRIAIPRVFSAESRMVDQIRQGMVWQDSA